jgi:orotate phosphoribosyltransferase
MAFVGVSFSMRDEVISLLDGRQGHFLLESGYHGEWWFRLDPLFDDPLRLHPFVTELAGRLAAHGVDAVCGPMTGGAKLARMIADELAIDYFFTERFERPGAAGLFPVEYLLPAAQRERVRGKAVAIVDDAVSAGSAVRGTEADLRAYGARPVALGALFIFGEAAARFAAEKDLALEAIAQMPLGVWQPSDCPLCKAGITLEKMTDTM